MSRSGQRLMFAAAALLLLAPAARAEQNGVTSTMPPKSSGVAAPGPQNPGGRMPESGKVPNTPGSSASQDSQAGAGAKLSTGNH